MKYFDKVSASIMTNLAHLNRKLIEEAARDLVELLLRRSAGN
jgi:hypothetical protein